MKARVLLYDIEVSSLNIDAWNTRETDAIRVVDDWYMLSFAWKWLGEKQVKCLALPDFKGYKKDRRNDQELVTALHKLFDEADIVIAHNGDKFDQKKSNTRFLFHGLNPPSPYKSIDTLKVLRRNFKLTSNRLNDAGKFLKVGKKVETGGYDLWVGCYNGDSKSWKKMKKYNKQDVVLLEEVYLKLRPWITNHPPLNILENNLTGCPNCGESQLQKRGTYPTKTGIKQNWWCLNCRAWSKSRVTERMKPEYV